DLEAAIDDVRALRDRPSGVLRINCSRVAALDRLTPMIGGFLKAHPEISLDIVTDDRLVDIVAGRFDAGIRLGEMVEKDMVAVRLGGELRMIVVAAPAYLARHGTPRNPRELKSHLCINFRMATDGGLYRWEFERGKEKLEVAVQGPLTVTEPDVARDA